MAESMPPVASSCVSAQLACRTSCAVSALLDTAAEASRVGSGASSPVIEGSCVAESGIVVGFAAAVPRDEAGEVLEMLVCGVDGVGEGSVWKQGCAGADAAIGWHRVKASAAEVETVVEGVVGVATASGGRNGCCSTPQPATGVGAIP